jgi:MFS family permease
MPGLLIHVYSSNYEPNKRGQNISWNFICSSIVGIVFSYGFGLYLDNYKSYNLLFVGMGGVSLLSSVALFLMPSNQPAVVGIPSMLGGLSFIIKDSLFGKMLLGWMLMGLGVIMTIPLRIEYMAGEGGIGISNQEVAMVVMSYSFAGILTSRLWGKLFDRIPFVPYRISLNLFLLASVLLFFTANSFYGLILGSVLAGIANGGASIAWTLWVTKLAPIGLESEYMGAHMFLTGVRGFCAPFLGYMVLNMLDFKGVAYTSSILILCSLLIFCTALKADRLSN